MIKRDFISWWIRPKFLQPWGRPSKTLFAGPWIGEFGWELINWQAFCRKLSRNYQSTIICCRKGNEALYEDFADKFVFHNIRGTLECNKFRDIQNPEEMERIIKSVPAEADHLNLLGWQPLKRKEFIRFGTRRSDLKTDILFHPRHRDFGADRNWSRQNWEELILLLRKEGLTLGCIGLSRATKDLEGDFIDYRDKPLKFVMDLMASAKMVVGPSSGPMHLASLCGTAHLVWTDRKRYARGRVNRYKYEKWWNPFDTRALVLDQWGFEPSVQIIHENSLNFMDS